MPRTNIWFGRHGQSESTGDRARAGQRKRTREIGLRLAVGAKRWQILLQFLSEAIILSTTSGIIGVGVGIGAAYILTHFAGWPIIIAPQAVVIAFFFSVVVGIVFGLYPANKASLMNPIDALRYE